MNEMIHILDIKISAYRVNSAKPPKSPGGGLIVAFFRFFSPPSGGWGAVFNKKFIMLF